MNSSPTQIISGHYQLIAPLGTGGMGSVYKAYDRLNQQIVALKKVFISDAMSHLDLRLILAQEFQVLASLRHPHIISVLGYGFDDKKQPYFTVNLVEDGQTILDAGRHKTLANKIGLLAQVLQALMYLHRRKILHRDIKPGNILVTVGQSRLNNFWFTKVHRGYLCRGAACCALGMARHAPTKTVVNPSIDRIII